MPEKIKQYLFKWMELGQTIVRRYWGESSLADRSRNYTFARRLNELMGRKNLKSNFEYYDLLLTKADTPLVRHMDYMNDYRKNYNHCFVYSFHQRDDGVLYKVSFVMTTRSHAGSAMEEIRSMKGKSKHNK